jgi:hypothetical protein
MFHLRSLDDVLLQWRTPGFNGSQGFGPAGAYIPSSKPSAMEVSSVKARDGPVTSLSRLYVPRHCPGLRFGNRDMINFESDASDLVKLDGRVGPGLNIG